MGVEQALKLFWLLEVVLRGAGIRCQVGLVPQPDLEGGFGRGHWQLAREWEC